MTADIIACCSGTLTSETPAKPQVDDRNWWQAKPIPIMASMKTGDLMYVMKEYFGNYFMRMSNVTFAISKYRMEPGTFEPGERVDIRELHSDRPLQHVLAPCAAI